MLRQRVKRFRTMLFAKPGGRYLPGFVFVWLLFLPAVSMAAPVTADQLARQADSLKLSEKRYWHTLLHYRPSWRGLRSLIDDPEFFLAENGKRRPDEELAATLGGFLEPVGADPDS
ncbi:MAG: hypothetical protein GWN87_03725, partial [Desulfuromonadales bacterium]|nr:hypothetical protein [Desulfuromonadales bacterium]